MIGDFFDCRVPLVGLKNLLTVAHHDEAVADHKCMLEVVRYKHA